MKSLLEKVKDFFRVIYVVLFVDSKNRYAEEKKLEENS